MSETLFVMLSPAAVLGWRLPRGTFLVTVGLAVAAAVLLGLGFVLQQRVARNLPHADTLSPRLFADLIGEPVWLAGIVSMVGGQVLGAVALGRGDVSLVEPLLTTNLLFALLLARVLSAQRLGGREWAGAVLLVVGVVTFIVAAHPRATARPGGELSRGLFLAGVGTLAAAGALLARRRIGPSRAVLLASAAGLLFGIQDGLTREGMLMLRSGLARLLTSWPGYAVVMIAIAGLLLVQSAFEAAPLAASLPVLTAVEPLTGIAYGIGVFGEVIRLAAAWVVMEAAGLIAMIAGLVLVARSPMITHDGAGGR
jgi:drug/metabolite transporter (DMT)-like permease